MSDASDKNNYGAAADSRDKGDRCDQQKDESKEGPAISWNKGRTKLTVAAMVLIFAALLFHVLHEKGILTRDRLELMLQQSGPFGVLLFIIFISIGELMHIPGSLFVIIAIYLWGPYIGWLMGYAGAVCATSFCFVVVRGIAGSSTIEEAELPFGDRILAWLDSWPLVTVFSLRACLFLAPAVNYFLAMSPISTVQYCIATSLGLLVSTTWVTLLVSTVFNHLDMVPGESV